MALSWPIFTVNIEYMSELNKEQQKAIDTVNGPILILAGAGSGKTRVLTEKIAHLIIKKHAEPEEILAVTFTNKAANEMKQRVARILAQKGNATAARIWMGTFHSICLRIIKANYMHLGLNPQFSIYDADDQLDVVKEALKKLGMADKKINPRSIHSFISSAKNELIDAKSYKKYAEGYFQMIVSEVYPIYQEILAANSAVDFDDLLMMTVNLFLNHADVLEKYQNMFKFILIDEYQDTNHAQYLITKLLADKHKNICVVGDDAQSIYGFRGATIKNILDFEKDYPNTTVIKLEQNYRSTQTILDASNQIILRNKNQKRKEMWTENKKGEKLLVYEARNEREEANWVAGQIAGLIENNVPAGEIVVLYRTNAQSRALEEGFLQAGVAYKIVGGVRFYDRREVRDILAYLKILFNPADDLSFKRIINVPRRGVGPKKIEELTLASSTKSASILNYLMSLPASELGQFGKQIAEFVQMMVRLTELSKKVNVSTLINEIFVASGYMKWLDDGSTENEARIENIKELISVATKYKDVTPEEGLEMFLNEVALLEGADDKKDDDGTEKITLMTIHASKGLEFDYVFVTGMEEGIFPHVRSYADPSEMEEERRLAYVATTRAKQRVALTYTESRTYFGATNSNPVSRFLSDIPKNLLEFESPEIPSFVVSSVKEEGTIFKSACDLKRGDKVGHAVFGKGTITDIDDSIVIVNFNGKSKELSLEYANLQKAS